MSKKESQWKTDLVPAVAGRDYVRQPNGVIVVKRTFSHPGEAFKPEPVADYFSMVDHTLEIGKKQYKKQVDEAEEEFSKLIREKLRPAGKFLAVALQGRDAAGKTGTRKILDQAIDDPKIFQTICIGAPTSEELQHGYLHRFLSGERMPRYGEIRVFDRTWNERVLVERVMELTPKDALQRSFAELRTFEWLLVQQGAVLVKLWLDITKEEQKRRFEDRIREKPWKFGEADKVARKNWDGYTIAGNEMIFRTGTEYAPWHIVSSDDKSYCRVTALQLCNQKMREALA